MTDVVLYDYWRSSASYRVRIALNMAGIGYRSVAVDLVAGEQRSEPHLDRNPQGYVPALEIDGLLLTQSLAIVDYIDETRGCGFLPEDPAGRARTRALAHVIAMDIHPVCNSNVVARVAELTGGGDAAKVEWMRDFIRKGLVAFERLLDHPATGRFCHGDRPGVADFCLVPQLYNAERWGAQIADLGRIHAIRIECDRLQAFIRAHPDAAR
ncbi:maleylacetoacetate isomerase [Hoeflea marina]|uniref:Maleylacetoacetate isomerase n=1 Tax=Hoeflea marina TaxID=274592 RepID=A0A317PV73_9HYPH|nr:maleylacetoacetate isomerase [Hoeflea marina]PWW04166.1 maleylacetoacetate isomerase [Hoeflea marina]